MRIRHLLCALCLAFVAGGSQVPTRASEAKDYSELIRSCRGVLVYNPLQSFKDIAAQGGRIVGEDPEVIPGPGGGTALLFKGKTVVTFGATPDLDTQETTIELWFRPEFASPAPFNPCLVAKRESGDHRQTRWSVHVHGDYSAIDLWNGRQVASFRPPWGSLARSQWYHLVITSSRSGTRAYLNGVPCLPHRQSWQINLAEKNRPLNLASSQPAGAEFFAGAISHVAIYGRVLSDEEIAAHADARGFQEARLAGLKVYEEILRAEADEAARLKEARERRRQELMEDPALFARGAPSVYQGETLSAIDIPVGGIGVGAIHMDGTARRHAWQIFGQVGYRSVPHSFFGLLVKWGAKRVERVLQTVPEDELPPMASVRLQARYPIATYEFLDSELPIRVILEAYNPLIPTNLRDSALPYAVYQIRVDNVANHPVSVTFLASQLNVAGYRGDGRIEDLNHPRFGENINRVIKRDKSTWLVMSQIKKQSPQDSLVLFMTGENVHGQPSWIDFAELRRVIEEGADRHQSAGQSSAPSSKGRTVKGALWSSFELSPGESRSLVCVLTWFFADLPAGSGNWSCRGRRYEAWWTSAEEVAAEVEARLSKLEAATRLYADSLYETNLPFWFLDRIASQVAILRSPTVFWCKDGYFGGWEGCNIDAGCCPGNCNHVWHYAQAHARLFPELGRLLREQEFRFQKQDGAIPHRQPNEFPAFDGQCGAVLNSYREHLLSREGSWLAANWASIKKAMDYIIQRWDADEDGVLGGPQWNTLDGELGGSSSWLGSLYLAALGAAERMAALQNDQASAQRYRKIRLAGQFRQDATFFNGQYYIQIPDPTPHEDYGEGCGIDQVLGQWWAHQLDLGWIYPPEHVQTALRSLFRYNFQGLMKGLPQSPRKFVADEDAGMQMFTWPPGTEPPASVIRYASEVMTGFEYAGAAAMIQAGLLKEGFTVGRAIALRYDGRKRTGLTPGNYTSWGYSGNPFGDDECGKFYARAMSSWSLLLACQGFVYDGPAKTIGFCPRWRPEDHVSFFTASEGWGVFRQKREPQQQMSTIEVRWGSVPVERFIAQVPSGVQVMKALCTSNDKPVDVHLAAEGDRIFCTLPRPVILQAGDKFSIVLKY